jgi:hypothetical protein
MSGMDSLNGHAARPTRPFSTTPGLVTTTCTVLSNRRPSIQKAAARNSAGCLQVPNQDSSHPDHS